MKRRTFLALAPAAMASAPKLDRAALVARHKVRLRAIDPDSPLSVGNGEFAFSVDPTGLQSLPDLYEAHVPLCTLAQWGWHSFPIPDGLRPDQLRLEMFDTYGRQVGYATSSKGQEPLFNWLRENPHRLNLGRIGFRLDGASLRADRITNIDQTLDLWTGAVDSRFQLQGTPVTVRTRCHESRDCVSVEVQSPLAVSGRLAIALEFPYGSTAMSGSDWSNPAKHATEVAAHGRTFMHLRRRLDADEYHVRLDWHEGTAAEKREAHEVWLRGPDLGFRCEFSRRPVTAPSPDPSPKHWPAFWSGGGAIDLSGSTDARAGELERRIVLSQYLTAIQCAGSLPPQETGLTCNSWYGKYHLEMHWWHAAHFPMWGRTPLLERSLPWYESILPAAKKKAAKQSYKGARWPKMMSPDGHDSPSPIGELLIWQQPHPISLLEYCHLVDPSPQRLKRYANVVFETADWMADFAVERNGEFFSDRP